MPCPVHPQPPGLFDGIPLLSAFGFWAAILSVLLIGGGLVGTVWGVRTALRQPLGSPQRRYLWVRLGQLGGGLVLLVLLILDILWQLALDAWKSTLALACTAAQDAAHQARSEANFLFLLICVLLILNAFLTVYLSSIQRRSTSLSTP